jgi:hypothetical protein
MVTRITLIVMMLLGLIALAIIMVISAIKGILVVFNFIAQDLKLFVLCALCVLLVPTAFLIYFTRR